MKCINTLASNLASYRSKNSTYMAWQKSVLAVKNARSRSTTISTAGHMEPIKSSQSHKHTFSFTTPTERTLPPSLSVSRATKQALTSSHNILANSSPLRRWTLMGVELGKTLVMTQICPRLQKLMQYEMIRLMTNFSCDKPKKKASWSANRYSWDYSCCWKPLSKVLVFFAQIQQVISRRSQM